MLNSSILKNLLSKKISYQLLAIVFFVFLIIIRLHNSLSFNPFWGYDGGSHVDYILSLAQENKMPDIATNAVAWHEPLYYFIFAGLLKIVLFFKNNLELVYILKFLGLLQAVLSIITSIYIYKLTKLLTKNNLIVFLTTVFICLLPNFNQASTFVTNELLNYFFFFLICWFFIKNFIQKKNPNIKKYILLGVLLGLALLTKITAVILLAIICAILLFQVFKNKRYKELLKVFLVLMIAIAIYSPWQIYKQTHVFKGLTLNNIDYLAPQPLVIDQRINFFLSFDKDIFKFPYWYSGGRAFWSMFYADSFYDYYSSIENRDYINYLEKNDFNKLTWTSQKNTYVTTDNFKIAKILVWYALLPCLILIFGFGFGVYKFFKTKKEIFLLYFLVPISYFSAMLYFAYRYPYYDKGIVKTIFIFPFYYFLFIGGLKFFQKLSKKSLYIILPIILIYCLLLFKMYWIVRFNY